MAPEPSAGFKSSWGLMLQEMNWMAIDYHQERMWKLRVCDTLKMGVKRRIQRKDRDRRGWAANQAAKIISMWWQQLDLMSPRQKAEMISTGNRILPIHALHINNRQDWQLGQQSPELLYYCCHVTVQPELLQIEHYSADIELEPLDLPEQLFIPVTKVFGVGYSRNQHAAVDQYLSRMEAAGAKVHSVVFRPPDDELDSVSLSLNSDDNFASLVLNDYVLRKNTVMSSMEFDPKIDPMHFGRFKPYMPFIPHKRLPMTVKPFIPRIITPSPNATSSPVVAPSTTNITPIKNSVKEPYLLSYLVQRYDMKPDFMNWELLSIAMGMYGGIVISTKEIKRLHQKIDTSYPKTPLVIVDKLFGMVYTPKYSVDEFEIDNVDRPIEDSDSMEAMVKQVAGTDIDNIVGVSSDFENLLDPKNNPGTREKIEALASNSINKFIEWYSHVDPKVAGQTNALENTEDLLPAFLACVALKYPENNPILQ